MPTPPTPFPSSTCCARSRPSSTVSGAAEGARTRRPITPSFPAMTGPRRCLVIAACVRGRDASRIDCTRQGRRWTKVARESTLESAEGSRGSRALYVLSLYAARHDGDMIGADHRRLAAQCLSLRSPNERWPQLPDRSVVRCGERRRRTSCVGAGASERALHHVADERRDNDHHRRRCIPTIPPIESLSVKRRSASSPVGSCLRLPYDSRLLSVHPSRCCSAFCARS